MALTDRDSLANAVYRLLNTDASDDDMIEHDDTSLEGLYLILQDGVDDAQAWVIDKCGRADFWLTPLSTKAVSICSTERYTC